MHDPLYGLRLSLKGLLVLLVDQILKYLTLQNSDRARALGNVTRWTLRYTVRAGMCTRWRADLTVHRQPCVCGAPARTLDRPPVDSRADGTGSHSVVQEVNWGDVRVAKRELGVRMRAMRMAELREARADPENRQELAPSSQLSRRKTSADAPVALSAFLDRFSCL